MARSTLMAGTRSTNVTSVCQLLALPCSASMGSTAPPSPATVGRPGEGAQQPCEGPLVGVGRVLLVAQEDDLVPEQRGPQPGHGGEADVTADPDAADDGTDHPAHLGDADVLVRALTAESRRMVLDAGHTGAPFGWLVPGGRRHSPAPQHSATAQRHSTGPRHSTAARAGRPGSLSSNLRPPPANVKYFSRLYMK